VSHCSGAIAVQTEQTWPFTPAAAAALLLESILVILLKLPHLAKQVQLFLRPLELRTKSDPG
jgi:hypothetical protein